MPRPVSPGRIVFDNKWLDMPIASTGGYDSILKPIELEKHIHDTFELTYLLDGEVTWELETGEKLHLTGGEFAIVQPNMPHQGEWEIIRPCKLFWLTIDPSHKNALQHTTFTKSVINEISMSYRESGNSVFSGDDKLHSLFKGFLSYLIEFKENKLSSLSSSFARSIICQIILKTVDRISLNKTPKSYSKTVSSAIEFMRNHLSLQIGVIEIAESVNMNPQRLNRIFKRETGQTPADFLQRLRCGEAMEKLRKTSLSITEIAFNNGFSSSQYFAKVFKKYCGQTPSQFRERK